MAKKTGTNRGRRGKISATAAKAVSGKSSSKRSSRLAKFFSSLNPSALAKKVNNQFDPRTYKRLFWGGLIVLFLGGILWWRTIYNEPERVFWRMLGNSLRTSSVTEHIHQEGNGQILNQTSTINSGLQHNAFSTTQLTQGQNNELRVITEAVGTPFDDYVRYTSVSTPQLGTNGQPLDYSALYNIWGKTEAPDRSITSGNLYGELSLGIIPIGQVAEADRAALVKQAKSQKAFVINMETITKKIVNGRPQYTYQLSINPEQYVGFLKQFAKVSGLNQLSEVDPSSYAGSGPVRYDVIVDVWSATVVKAQVPDGSRQTTYEGWNITYQFATPTDSIPVGDLQNRLQQVQ